MQDKEADAARACVLEQGQGLPVEQLREKTTEVQAAQEEAARLRRALVDAELELQRVTSADSSLRRSDQVYIPPAASFAKPQNNAALLAPTKVLIAQRRPCLLGLFKTEWALTTPCAMRHHIACG